MAKTLKEAIEANDAAGARKALKAVKDVSRKLPKVGTPLNYACERGADAVVAVLLEAGAAVPKNGLAVDHPFAVAAEGGHTKVVELLASRDGSGEFIGDVLLVSILNGKEASVRTILAGSKPQITKRMVATAAWWKDGRILDLLLAQGVDVDVPNSDPKNPEQHGQTALHDAAGNGYIEPVRLLLARGAGVNAVDVFGRTPLMRLAGGMSYLEDAYRTWQEHQAKRAGVGTVIQRGQYGDRERNDPMDTARLLLEHGADVRHRDALGNGVLMHYYVERFRDEKPVHKGFVELLRTAGAAAEEGQMALIKALRADDVAAAGRALESGADVNRATPMPVSNTPLILARSAKMVKFLLKAGADPNKPAQSDLPLISAARSGELDIVKLLIEAGANIHAIEPSAAGSEYVANAYSAAEGNNKVETAAYLKSLGAGKPVLEDWEPLEAGVVTWENFSEVIVKGEVGAIAKAVARVIGGKVTENVYGKALVAGKRTYLVIRPVNMAWCNLLTVTPARRMFEESDEGFLQKLAAEAGAPVMVINYSDAAGASEMKRFEPAGSVTTDQSGEEEMLDEIVGAMGKKAPKWAKEKKKALGKKRREELDIEKLAAAERFVIAWGSLDAEEGRKVDVSFTNLPAGAFDGAALVST